jgi:hypothetical protein
MINLNSYHVNRLLIQLFSFPLAASFIQYTTEGVKNDLQPGNGIILPLYVLIDKDLSG